MRNRCVLSWNRPRIQRQVVPVFLAVLFVGCIDDSPSGPGRMESSGGTTSLGSGGVSGGSGGSAGGSRTAQGGSAAGEGSSGGATSSSAAAGQGGAISMSHGGSSGGAGGHGGTTVSSLGTSSGGSSGRGGATASRLAGSSGGSPSRGGTTGLSSSGGTSGGQRDAGVAPDSAGDASVVSFTAQIQPMLKANCTSCHGASRQNAGIRLDSYTVVKANANAANRMIQTGAMPPSGALSNDLKRLFQSWVDQGALDN